MSANKRATITIGFKENLTYIFRCFEVYIASNLGYFGSGVTESKKGGALRL